MRTPPPVCYPDDTLTDVTEKFRLADEGRLPVVARDDPGTVLGVISHTDVLATYERLVLDQTGVDDTRAEPNPRRRDDGERVDPPDSRRAR